MTETIPLPQREETWQPLCFSIAGEYIAKLARNLVLEGRWSDAIILLNDGIEGLSLDQAIDILRGKSTMIGHSPRRPGGENTLDLVDENPEEVEGYLKAVRFIYCGIYKVGSRYYRPYAYVTDFGPHDLEACEGRSIKAVNEQEHNKLLTQARGLHYADNRISDRASYMHHPDLENRGGTILWKLVDTPPFWVRTFPYLTTALDDFLGNDQQLSQRGHHQYYRHEIPTTVEPRKKSPEEIEADRILLQKEAEEEVQRELQYQQELASMREEIMDQAQEQTDGFIYLNLLGKRTKIPKAPFERWALRGTKFQHLAPPWKPVAGSGWKMQNDDKDHTDWMIAAELSLDYAYRQDEETQKVIDDAVQEVQERLLNFKCTVLCGSGWTIGRVVHPERNQKVEAGSIIAIPFASKDYVISALTACQDGTGAVITEAGGEMAHLAILGLEKNFRLVRVKDARKIYPEGCQISVNCDEGLVKGMMLHE